MIAHGDIEVVNLGTGKLQRRVTGDGESRLEDVAKVVWDEFAIRREVQTTWRRDSESAEMFFFLEGFQKGVEHALQKRPRGQER